MSRGAPNRVLRAAGLIDDRSPDRPAVQGAACPDCGWELHFFTDGEYGRTMEQCTNTTCDLSVPHPPIPSPDAKVMPPESERKERISRRKTQKAEKRETSWTGLRP